jgi:hypothetical protein
LVTVQLFMVVAVVLAVIAAICQTKAQVAV